MDYRQQVIDRPVLFVATGPAVSQALCGIPWLSAMMLLCVRTTLLGDRVCCLVVMLSVVFLRSFA